MAGANCCFKTRFGKSKAGCFQKYGVDESKITYSIEETNDPPLSFFIKAPQAPVLLEGLKIAYEFAVTAIPEYFNDDWAKLFSSFLHKGENSDLIKARIESLNPILSSFEKELRVLVDIPLHVHAISLSPIKGLGLVCFVKIFDRIFPYHISNKQYFSTFDKEIAVYNNCVEKSHILKLDLRWKDIRLSINLNGLNQEEEMVIKDALSKSGDSISLEEHQIPVFTKTGESFATSLADITPYIFKKYQVIDFAGRNVSFHVSLPENELFVKYKPTNKLIELMGFDSTYEIAL